MSHKITYQSSVEQESTLDDSIHGLLHLYILDGYSLTIHYSVHPIHVWGHLYHHLCQPLVQDHYKLIVILVTLGI